MQNDLQKKFDSLPEELKNAITSVDFAKSLQEIGRSSGLHIDQLDQLFEEVGFVLLGITHPSEFGRKIGTLFKLPEVSQNSLVKEVDEKIFKPIRTSLMSLYNKSASPSINTYKSAEIKTITQTIPHETDNMSREDILSAIENPIVKHIDESTGNNYIAKRGTETSDPNQYLKQRNELIQKMKSVPLNIGAVVPKKSLAEEAVLIAQKKVADYKNTPPTKERVSPNTNNPIIVQKAPPSALIKRTTTPETAKSSMEKLNSVVRIPRQSVNTANSSPQNASRSKNVDPYREIL